MHRARRFDRHGRGTGATHRQPAEVAFAQTRRFVRRARTNPWTWRPVVQASRSATDVTTGTDSLVRQDQLNKTWRAPMNPRSFTDVGNAIRKLGQPSPSPYRMPPPAPTSPPAPHSCCRMARFNALKVCAPTPNGGWCRWPCAGRGAGIALVYSKSRGSLAPAVDSTATAPRVKSHDRPRRSL